MTCKHALVDDAGSTDQHCITGHDGSIAGDDHDITWDEVSRHRFFNLCIKGKKPHRRAKGEKNTLNELQIFSGAQRYVNERGCYTDQVRVSLKGKDLNFP